MIRRLSREELDLWARVRRAVRPLPHRRRPAAEPEEAAEPAVPSAAVPGAEAPAATAAAAAPGVPPLSPLEPRMRRRLSGGRLEVDARIDLHGMRQSAAFEALVEFLRQSQRHGHRTVLVITGKGDPDAGNSGRGVLRQSVPHWLARPEFRTFIVGYEEAARRHGGAGALYVRLRRPRR